MDWTLNISEDFPQIWCRVALKLNAITGRNATLPEQIKVDQLY
jgi:hypothetical protein